MCSRTGRSCKRLREHRAAGRGSVPGARQQAIARRTVGVVAVVPEPALHGDHLQVEQVQDPLALQRGEVLRRQVEPEQGQEGLLEPVVQRTVDEGCNLGVEDLADLLLDARLELLWRGRDAGGGERGGYVQADLGALLLLDVASRACGERADEGVALLVDL